MCMYMHVSFTCWQVVGLLKLIGLEKRPAWTECQVKPYARVARHL
jgi:hypothetical protein